MVKKHKNYKPQERARLKPTVGQLEFVNVVYMEKERVDGETRVYATCTCGTWRSSQEADTFGKLGLEAKAHADASEGACRLRSHAVSAGESTPDPLSEEAVSS